MMTAGLGLTTKVAENCPTLKEEEMAVASDPPEFVAVRV
jgi:hypothetical protein